MTANPVQSCFRCSGLAENPVESHIYTHGEFRDVIMCCDCTKLSLDNPKEFWCVIREKPKEEKK